MSVRMRHTKSHTGNRRSHHALKEPALSKCSNCTVEHLMHRLCENCGHYNGRKIIDVVKELEKKKQDKDKDKEKEKEKEKV